METPEMDFKFSIEDNFRSGDPIDEEIASYVVKDDDDQFVLIVESRITLDEQIDGLVINRVAIIVDPDEPTMDLPATQLGRILARLANDGHIEPGDPVHLDSPGEYFLTLDEPYSIKGCYYQKGYEAEITNWLREFLIRDVTIARILAIIDTEEE